MYQTNQRNVESDAFELDPHYLIFFSYRENKLAANRFLLKNKEFVVLSLSICTIEKLYPSIVSFLCFSLRDLLNFCRFYKSPIIAHSYAHS